MLDPRVPVTLLTGFLGAGKTTVLNAVLADDTTERVAVIMNEFGDVGLDHDLIEESTEEIVLMQSGCLCCTVRGDLSKTVTGLFIKKWDGDIDFDRIVIETTGLAEPAPIAQTLLVDPMLARNTRLDGIVTVADAANGTATLDSQFEAVSQAAMADLIILSKTDLVTPDKLAAFEDRLLGLNPGVRIKHAIRGENVAKDMWGLSAMRPAAKPNDVLSWTLGETKPTEDGASDPFGNLSGFGASATPAAPLPVHDARIGSASIVLDEPLSEETFDLWLDTLVGLRGPDILRVKGIVFLEGIDKPFVFHGVQHVFDPPVQLAEWPSDDRQSRIVVIARDLTRPELQHSFEMLRATKDETPDS